MLPSFVGAVRADVRAGDVHRDGCASFGTPFPKDRFVPKRFRYRESAAKRSVMIKLMVWGVVFYFIYRYFMLKQAVREGQRRESLHQRMQDARSTGPSSEDKGEYIDYEEVK
jgi:hypothetical protein